MIYSLGTRELMKGFLRQLTFIPLGLTGSLPSFPHGWFSLSHKECHTPITLLYIAYDIHNLGKIREM